MKVDEPLAGGNSHTFVREVSPSGEMVLIPGGTFRMGSDRHYPEEAPVHRVTVDGFWIDRTPVTNREFRKFVNATGYVTFAEIKPDAKDYPGALPHMLKAGSLVFSPPPQHAVDLRDWSQWWNFKFGANWRQPYGPGSPRSAGLTIIRSCTSPIATPRPTPNGPARICRPKRSGSSPRAADSTAPSSPGATSSRRAGRQMANTWQGKFPQQNLQTDGYERTSPVTAFPPNGYGIHDMIGNVWEWTTDWWSPKHEADAPKACCIPENPRGGPEDGSYDPCQPQIKIPRKVSKAARTFARRTTAAAIARPRAMPKPVDTSTSHVGFRCVSRGSRRHERECTAPLLRGDMTWLARCHLGRAAGAGRCLVRLSREVHHRFWTDIVDRLHGPMTFRFFLQPAMARLPPVPDGISDARAGHKSFFWTSLWDPNARPTPEGRPDVDRAHDPARDQHGCDLSVQGARPVLSGGSRDDGPPTRGDPLLRLPLDRRAHRALVVRSSQHRHAA